MNNYIAVEIYVNRIVGMSNIKILLNQQASVTEGKNILLPFFHSCLIFLEFFKRVISVFLVLGCFFFLISIA